MNKPVSFSNPANITVFDRSDEPAEDAELFASQVKKQPLTEQRGSGPKAQQGAGKSRGANVNTGVWDHKMPAVPVLRYVRSQGIENKEETRGEDDKSGRGDETASSSATGKARDRTLFASPQDEAKKIVSDAAKEKIPETALEGLNTQYAQASADVKKAILADPATKQLLDAVAKAGNSAFENQPGPQVDAARVGVFRLNELSQKLEPELAGALAAKVFQGHEEDYRAILRGGTGVNPKHTKLLEDILGRIAVTVQGKQAAEELAVLPETPAEAKARTSIEAKFKSDPAALAEFRKLTQDRDFQTLDPGARLALLSQISNYPKIEVVKNLHLLAGMPSFRSAEPLDQNTPSLDNQQRSAKIIAYYSQYSSGDPVIRDNTLRGLLTPGPKRPAFGWDEIGEKIFGETSAAGNKITFNSNKVPAGNEPIKDPKLGAHVAETIAHEYNHFVNRDEANGDFRNFMGEYRAFLVGQRAATGKWPSQQEIFIHTAELVSPGGGYDRISATYWDDKSPEGRKMVEFMATIMGEDPKTAKPDSYTHVTRKLSEEKTATLPANLRPVKVAPDAPNMDNH
jgi:hypothetical protein